MKRNYVNLQADLAYRQLVENMPDFPFVFEYVDKTYRGFQPEFFTLKDKNVQIENEKETQTFLWTFAEVFEVKLILTHYFSHGTTEWTVYFENVSEKNSEVLENLRMEVIFHGKYPTLKGILGDHDNFYQPYAIDLTNNHIEFSSDSGRATHINFPYFNLEHGGGGTMLAIGWAGTWKARFQSDGERTTYIVNSVNGTRTFLKPGEKIRTALFVFAPYAVRNEHYATNFWRDWFVHHNLPKADKKGKDLSPLSTVWLMLDTGKEHSDGSISECYTTWKASIEKSIQEGIKPDFRWIDAGWYMAPDFSSAEPNVVGHDWWDTIGTWELDPVKWPEKTFLELTEYGHEHGMKTLLWFEPERVTDPDNLEKNFGYKKEWALYVPGVYGIANNIGDPKCREWTVKRICKMLRENKLDMSREDNNFDAAKLWGYLDDMEGDNRRGITEYKFIMAHYDMWDEIIACTLSYGGCGFVDSCASGGGRNDLESLRRGVPLLRSDYDRHTIGRRLSMTTAFNKWIPFCGACSLCDNQTNVSFHIGEYDKYSLRASYLPVLNLSAYKPTQDPNTNFEMIRYGFEEWDKVKPYLLSEFYVLTPWHSVEDINDFTAYCFYDPNEEKGYLFAFRQERCVRSCLKVSLPFSNGEEFVLTDVDNGHEITCSGNVEICFAEPRSAHLFEIRKQNQ